jgi:Tfp pilus assembly protein PilF
MRDTELVLGDRAMLSGRTGVRPWRRVRAATQLLLVAAACVASAACGKGKHPPGKVPLEPIDASSARIDVRTLTGIDPGELANLLAADAKVAAFAKRAADSAKDDDAKARAVRDALQARKQKRAFGEWSRVDLLPEPPATAAATLAAIARDGAELELYPLEIAALAVASLRALEVPALLAEVYRYPNERSPLDPSGRFGYYAAFVPTRGGKGGHIYDAYAGRNLEPKTGDYAVLNDAQAIGAALGLRALHELNNLLDTKRALADSAAAVKLLPNSASAHSVRAAIQLTRSEQLTEGAAELQTALKLRDDAARHNNLAVLSLSQRNPFTAQPELGRALADAPDYALAILMQAALLMMVDEDAVARTRIEQAEKLDPSMALLPQIWAQYYMKNSDPDQAMRYAQEAQRRRPNDPQPLFILARIEHNAGREADARKHALAILTHVPPEDREPRKRTLRASLGATIFDDPQTPQTPRAPAAPTTPTSPASAPPAKTPPAK